MNKPRSVARAAIGLAVAAATLAACGSDAESTSDAKSASGGAQSIKVSMVDYKYEGLPASVKAGTSFSVTNKSTKELHEFVVIPLPETEKRAVTQLVKLPEAELGPILGAEPATVILAPPGTTEVITAVGDGTVSTPGRYIVLCAIPTGAKPQEYLDAVAAAAGKKPEGVAGGAPHFTAGMVAELKVT